MNELGAMDLGYNGNSFTWCNKRSGKANIHKRLDIVLVSTDWRTRFDRAGVLHLIACNSDHSPILRCLVLDHLTRPKPFKFLKHGLETSIVEKSSRRPG